MALFSLNTFAAIQRDRTTAVEDTEPMSKAGQPSVDGLEAESCMCAAASWREDIERKSASSKVQTATLSDLWSDEPKFLAYTS
jgi:hypothetical protein